MQLSPPMKVFPPTGSVHLLVETGKRPGPAWIPPIVLRLKLRALISPWVRLWLSSLYTGPARLLIFRFTRTPPLLTTPDRETAEVTDVLLILARQEKLLPKQGAPVMIRA